MEIPVREKTNLRTEMKRRLKALTREQKMPRDHAVCERLMEFPEFIKEERVYGYMALSWETGTREVIERLLERNIPVALPMVLGSEMEFFQIRSLSDLKEGAFHIPEPDESCEMVHWIDACMLVPGLAFSMEGKRLGKGGGYYDKFLSREPAHKTIALAYEFQLTEELPAEAHDRSVNYIVTENRTIRVN